MITSPSHNPLVEAKSTTSVKVEVHYIIYAKTSAEGENDYLLFQVPINLSEPLIKQKVHIKRLGDFKIIRREGVLHLGLPLNKSGGAEGVSGYGVCL